MVKYTDIYVAELMRVYGELTSRMDTLEFIKNSKSPLNDENKSKIPMNVAYLGIFMKQLKESPKGLQRVIKINELEKKLNSLLEN
ncbi:MAG: hypothetical protein AABX83_02405 [Nanoarchaeota archaeon]